MNLLSLKHVIHRAHSTVFKFDINKNIVRVIERETEKYEEAQSKPINITANRARQPQVQIKRHIDTLLRKATITRINKKR